MEGVGMKSRLNLKPRQKGTKALRDKLEAAGGKWNPDEKLWYVAYAAIRGTELEERIMTDAVKGKK